MREPSSALFFLAGLGSLSPCVVAGTFFVSVVSGTELIWNPVVIFLGGWSLTWLSWRRRQLVACDQFGVGDAGVIREWPGFGHR